VIFTARTTPVYRLRASQGVDSYGDPVEDWDRPERVLLPGAVVQEPTTEEEEAPGKRVTTGERVLYAPRALDLDEGDRVEVEGEVWRVEGRPKVRRGLAMGVYTSATLSRSEGGANG